MELIKFLEEKVNSERENTLLEQKAYLDGFFEGAEYNEKVTLSEKEKIRLEEKILFPDSKAIISA